MAQAAATYTPQAAIDLVRKFSRDAPVASIDSQVCDIVNSTIWTFYPWRWAQKSFTAIALTDGAQDFAVAAANNDIHVVMNLRITRTDTTPDQYHDLTVRDFLPPDLSQSSAFGIQSATYLPISDKIRLERAVSIGSTETSQIDGEYWRRPTKIVDGSLATVLEFPDLYWPVFVDGVKWQFFHFINDSRAGTVQTDKQGRRSYTGQLGVFMEGLFSMAQAEDYGEEGSEFPDSPLGASDYGGWGIYG